MGGWNFGEGESEMPSILIVMIVFALGVFGGKAEERVKEEGRKEWAREGQCVPSRYWEGTWVCGKGENWPSVWFERGEGK